MRVAPIRVAWLLLVLVASGNIAFAQAPNATATRSEKQPLSVRVVGYQIDAKYDAVKHTINASEVLTYKNLTGQPQQTFPFHLYLNAFQPQSTFMTEVRRSGTRGNGPDTAWDPKHFGSITMDKLEADGSGDLTSKMEFIHPDDNNAADRTVFQVSLAAPVAPNASVTFRMTFHDQLPEVVERTGYKHDFDMVGQWFPKVGVWWKDAWNCHQFHANSEFFADFGTFDVKITLPQNEILGAGGDLMATVKNSDGTQTLTYHSEDVHDFSWAASPSFTRRRYLDRKPGARRDSCAHVTGKHAVGSPLRRRTKRIIAPLRPVVRALSLRSNHRGRSAARGLRRRGHGISNPDHRRYQLEHAQGRLGAGNRHRA